MHFLLCIKLLALVYFFSSLILFCFPMIVAYIYNEPLIPFLKSLILSLIFSFFLFLAYIRREVKDINIKDSFFIVFFSWLGVSLLGTLPYLFCKTFGDFSFSALVNAFFESVSGFTTTGASVINDVEKLTKSLLFFRSLTQWLGGMGIVLLTVAIFPLFGVGGMQLYKAEVPGSVVSDKLLPRISDAAFVLWKVYIILSFIFIMILFLAGMPLFDSICHTFAAIATGGFSVKNASIAFYSPLLQWLIILFMIIAGANFSLHYALIYKSDFRAYFRSTEFIFFIFFIVILTLIGVLYNFFSTKNFDLLTSLRLVSFQIVSIITSTGFVTFDYEKWAFCLQILIIISMLIGACTGSTGGGIKVLRIVLALKFLLIGLFNHLKPKAVYTIRFDNKPVDIFVIRNVVTFIFAYIFIVWFSVLFLSFFNLDFLTSFSATLSSLGNIGPGFSQVGPVTTYFKLPIVVKIYLSLLMIVGRLEVFTVIVLFLPSFWRK